MKRQIKIENLKPLSINATYYGSGSGFVKTQKANEWMHEVFFQMDTEYNAEALTELREYFDPKLHCFSITLEAQYPKEIFMTKKKMISAKTGRRP